MSGPMLKFALRERLFLFDADEQSEVSGVCCDDMTQLPLVYYLSQS
jgi:hypothetical protein